MRSRTERLASGLRMHWLEAGQGPCVVLLHGFPELCHSWRFQLAALSDAFRVVAPDLRGYGGTDAPRGWRRYRMAHLIRDVVELIDVLGESRVTLVGHDWGGAVAWEVAQRRPDRLLRLAVLNCPHPRVMLRELASSPAQLLRSWYMLYFQIPGLMEWRIRRRPAEFVRWVFGRGAAGEPTFLSDESIAPYVEHARRTGFGPGFCYYRAAFREPPRPARLIELPTRLIWGTEDPFLGRSLARPERHRGLVRRLSVVWVEGAGHWVQQEAPGRVDRALREFLLE